MSWSYPLASEFCPRGVVGAMNLAVTVRAAMVDRENVKTGYGFVPPQHVHMTRLTKDRGSSFQEVQIVRTM